jgi:hypothetical protein
MLPLASNSNTPVNLRPDTPNQPQKYFSTDEKNPDEAPTFIKSDSTINQKITLKHFSFLSLEKTDSQMIDSLVYTESHKNMGSFINQPTKLEAIQQRSEELEVIVQYDSSENEQSPEEEEKSQSYNEIIDNIKVKEFNLERSFKLEE